MNKFIEYDIHNGLTLLKCAVMNILCSLENREIIKYEFNPYISPLYIKRCMQDSGWENVKDSIWATPNGDEFLYLEQEFKIRHYDS